MRPGSPEINTPTIHRPRLPVHRGGVTNGEYKTIRIHRAEPAKHTMSEINKIT